MQCIGEQGCSKADNHGGYMRLGLLFLLLSIISNVLSAADYSQDVIYGDDDRIDVYAEPNPHIRVLADSTAAMVYWVDMTMNEQGRWQAHTVPYHRQYGLCKGEPFYYQPTLANCSAFLVGEDLVATAGHCINSDSCPRYAFAFNFRMKNEDEAYTEFESADVYSCKQVIVSQFSHYQDYALVKLDRPVRGRIPLALRPEGRPEVGTGLFVIGHPMGLPTKIAGGANLRSWDHDSYFVANLDTYGGNSGSAVFNSETHFVEGILVRGEQDMERSSCSRSKKCSNNGCRGEDVTSISYVRDALVKTQ